MVLASMAAAWRLHGICMAAPVAAPVAAPDLHRFMICDQQVTCIISTLIVIHREERATETLNMGVSSTKAGHDNQAFICNR